MKEMEKKREADDIAREEARLAKDQEFMRAQYHQVRTAVCTTTHAVHCHMSMQYNQVHIAACTVLPHTPCTVTGACRTIGTYCTGAQLR